jgi:hypothetical protein
MSGYGSYSLVLSPDPDPDPLVLKPFGGLVHQSKKFFKLVCNMRGTLKKRLIVRAQKNFKRPPLKGMAPTTHAKIYTAA